MKQKQSPEEGQMMKKKRKGERKQRTRRKGRKRKMKRRKMKRRKMTKMRKKEKSPMTQTLPPGPGQARGDCVLREPRCQSRVLRALLNYWRGDEQAQKRSGCALASRCASAD